MKQLFLVLILSIFSITMFGQVSSSAVSGPEFSLEKLDTTAYYFGKISGKKYYIKFNSVSESKAEGFYFISGNDIFAKKEAFSVEVKRKNYHVTFGGQTLKIKTDFVFRTQIVGGKYAIKTKPWKLFNRYEWSELINFKKYSLPHLETYPRRYKEKIFDEVVIKKDVYYGNAKGYWDSYPVETETYLEILENGVLSSITKKDLDLRMDLYLPKGDTTTKRPLIMFIHGGGFYIGDKETEAMVEWCKYFAKMGYVTASINYRLGYKPLGPSVQRAGYRGLQDAHAAMRFLVSKKDEYKIDTKLIFVGGSSAGGVTSLNLAFMKNSNRPDATKKGLLYSDQGNIESSGNILKNKFKIKGVVNMWGAINDLSILKNSETAIISFHGDADNVVPIDHNYPFQDIKGNFSSVILEKMYGSLPIHIEAKKIGLHEELHIFESAGHSPHVDVDDNLNENFDFISEHVRDFLYEEIIETPCEILSVPATPFERAMPMYKVACEEFEEINWAISGGIITGIKDNSIRVIWFEDAQEHKLIVSGYYEGGAGFYDVYKF